MSAKSDKRDSEYSEGVRFYREWIQWMKQEIQNPARPEFEKEEFRNKIKWVEAGLAEAERTRNAPRKTEKRISASNVVGAVLLILVALALWPVWLLLVFVVNLMLGE